MKKNARLVDARKGKWDDAALKTWIAGDKQNQEIPKCPLRMMQLAPLVRAAAVESNALKGARGVVCLHRCRGNSPFLVLRH